MNFLSAIWLMLLGVLGAASIIVAKRPDAKDAIAKLAPYQGWMGAISALWGIWGVINAVIHISVLSVAPILWMTLLAVGVVQALLGFLLGIGILKSFAGDGADEKMDQLMAKLAPYQGTLGFISIGLGAWLLVASLIW